MTATIDSDLAWAAFARRDRAFDGRFVVAVRTTHIYCKPSCAARRPRRDNVAFLPDAAAARAAGYRACRRCLPDSAARDRAAVVAAAALVAQNHAPSLTQLAATVGYAPHHFHRLFRRLTGVTPAALARTHRADRALVALAGSGRVTDAIYAAGYAAPSRFYADAARWGMTPQAVASGGAGETISVTRLGTPLGLLSLAATARNWSRFAFESNDSELRDVFPRANIHHGDDAFQRRATTLLAISTPTDSDTTLPPDLRRVALRTLLHDHAMSVG